MWVCLHHLLPHPRLGLDMVEAEAVPVAKLGLSPVWSLEGHYQKPRGGASIDALDTTLGSPL